MIKVLEKGSERKFTVECEECNSKIEYELSDVSVLSYSGEKYIDCPVCGQPITLNI